MITALMITGALVMIISLIAGFASGSFVGFLAYFGGGIVASIMFFALSKILDNQESILYRLEYIEETAKGSRAREKKVCPNCSRQYDGDRNSCPHCGHRE